MTALRRNVRFFLIVVLAALAACDQPPPRVDPVPPKPAPPVITTPPSAPPAAPPAAARTIDEYKRILAQRVVEANTDRIHRGQLQPLLRAVVVLQFNVDGGGNIRNLRTLRTPEREAESIATASLQRTGKLPAPPTAILRGGLALVTETWLFQDNGRFQLRTLAEGQRGE